MILVAMYVTNVAASLLAEIENLKYFSIFHYYDFQAALMKNDLNELTILVFISMIVVCTSVGLICFQRRDIAV